MFGGTDRRWYSAEPCHPFLAIAQGKIANPLVLIDELEKAGTRSDYGRLWDCLLGFLEPETSVRYPDPALQTTLDLSQVSYVATANSLDPLPAPIRDRFRIVAFPKPAAGDLDALLPAVMADLAKERGLDQNWVRAARWSRACRRRPVLARRLGAPPAPHRRGRPARARHPRDEELTDEQHGREGEAQQQRGTCGHLRRPVHETPCQACRPHP